MLTFEGGGIREDEVRSYRDLWENGNRIAAGLIAHGMQPGDRFALFMRNHPEFVEVMVGTSISGCVFVPIDPRTRGAKLAYTLNNSECKGVIAADYTLSQLDEVRAQLPNLKWIWVLPTDERGDSGLNDESGVHDIRSVLNEPYRPVDVRVRAGSGRSRAG